MTELNIIPIKALTEEEKNIIRKYENIDEIVTLDYSKIVKNARYWRDYNYQGGSHGLAHGDEVKSAQNFLNEINTVFKYSEGNIKVDGKYGKETMKRVLEFQKYLNNFLRQNDGRVFVSASDEEKRLVRNIVSSFKKNKIDLYQDTRKRNWSGKDFDYELKMNDYVSANGRRGGYLKVLDKNGKHLKTITFDVGKGGDVKFSEDCVMLKEILEDGYLGIETRRAAKLLIENSLKEKEEEAVIPKKAEQIIKIGLSTKKYLEENKRAWRNYLGTTDEKLVEKMVRIQNIYLSLTYEEELELIKRGLPPVKIEKKGWFSTSTEEYSPTWQGMKYANMRDDVDYDKFLDNWLELLKENEITKKAYSRSVGGRELGEIKEKGPFVMLGTKEATKDVGIDLTDVNDILNLARDKAKKVYGEEGSKYVVEYINNVEKKIKSIIKEGGDIVSKLNEDKELMYDIYSIMDYYCGIPSIGTVYDAVSLTVDIPSNDGKLEKYVEEKLKTIVGKDAREITKEILRYKNDKNRRFELIYEDMKDKLKPIVGLLIIEMTKDIYLKKIKNTEEAEKRKKIPT